MFYIGPFFYMHIYINTGFLFTGNESFVYDALKKVPNVDVYWKADIPDSYHYKYNRRVQPILLVGHDHYHFVHTKEDYDSYPQSMYA